LAERAVWHPLATLAGRMATLALLVALLAAALLLPLRAHQDLYHFTFYVWFDDARNVWWWYNEAIHLPRVIALAGIGIVVGFARRGFYGRVFALLLPLTYLVITLVGWQFRDHPVFAQLEGPRLMTALRPATVFLAALGAHEAVRTPLRLLLGLVPRLRGRGATTFAGAATVAVAAFLLLSPRSPVDRERGGLPLLETTNQPTFTAIAESALALEAVSTPADKPIILGNPISWHASFWVPALTGRDVYHNDWLWFWRTVEYGNQELMGDVSEGLELDFLVRHGLTLLLVDTGLGEVIDAAETKPYLRRVAPGSPGGYAIYRVESPPGPTNGWITLEGGEVTALDRGPERLLARGRTDRAGNARIIINDYPRWRAHVNGTPVPIARSPEGYMLVPVPAGEVTVELRYITEPVGWLARGLVALGAILLIALVAPPPRPGRRSEPQGGGAPLRKRRRTRLFHRGRAPQSP
ncbi:MAG: hypothetical protein M3Q65_00775, partial [Chloroflexota bacterium]|nr:hypothetical protein [Chloroflexota bacterium]